MREERGRGRDRTRPERSLASPCNAAGLLRSLVSTAFYGQVVCDPLIFNALKGGRRKLPQAGEVRRPRVGWRVVRPWVG